MTTPHTRRFSHFPLAQLAVAFCLGILAANQSPHRSYAWLIVCAVCTLGATTALIYQRHTASGLLLLMSMLCAAGVLTSLDRTQNSNGVKQFLIGNEVGEKEQLVLTGTLTGPVEFARDRLYLSLSVERVEFNQTEHVIAGTVSLVAILQNQQNQQAYRNIDLNYGDRVRVKASLRIADQFRNPGVSTLTEYLERRQLDAVGSVKSPASITLLSRRSSLSPLALLYQSRQKVQTAIDSSFDTETAGVLDAAMLGNRFNLSSGVMERFRAGGTFHVLVISGLHISFLGGIVVLFARRLTRNRVLRFLSSTVVVWCYSLAVGAEASVVRAALMFTFVAFGSVVFRQASSLNALGGAAFLLLLHRPLDLFDPSLQLTFLSVLAIVVVAWPLILKLTAIGTWHPTRRTPYPPNCSHWLRTVSETLFWRESRWRKEIARSAHSYRLRKSRAAIWLERYQLQGCLRFVFCAVVVSVSVQILLLPLLITYFHRLSFSSILLNIGVSGLMAMLALVAGVALLLMQLSAALAVPFVFLANTLNWLMVHSVDPFTRLGLDSIRLPEYSGWFRGIYFLYYVPLFVLVLALSNWEPLRRSRSPGAIHLQFVLGAAVQLVLLAILIFHPWSARINDGHLHVDLLDVGQGDSALVTMPDGTTLLIDGGGRPNFFRGNDEAPVRDTRSIGETVVSEYLWWRGLDQVDYVLATHADADHIDGLNDVVRNFSVRAAIVARTPSNDPEFAHFAETLKSTNTPVKVIGAGDVLSFGEVSALVLAPAATSDVNAPSGNDDSLVLRLKFGSRAFLLTGDIEKTAESSILMRGRELGSDVVKVPHHGSRTSSTEPFVVATRPRFAIISVGQTSMFGHPHKEVVERWLAHAAQVLTTGRCGTISFSTDGSDLQLSTYVPCYQVALK
ncbi:MAG: hypothetical protein C5B55_05850 [Blastocatellia bacterium]|nr:MAG: hypothetical protein C5B55_05850 [Blastocatellia bacterium]